MIDYKVSKEFFGGIIHDRKKNLNIKLDSCIMEFIELLENKCDKNTFIQKYSSQIHSLEILNLFQEMIEIGLYKKNFELSKVKEDKDMLSAPFRIFYDISYGCNLRCIHCFTDSGEKKESELTLEEKYDFVNQCVELGVGRISIAGGEPLCCPDLYPFLEYCKLKNLSVSITTNGTLLTNEIIEKLNSYSLKTITVSLDGASKNSCDFVRGNGSYSLVMKGLNNISKYYKGKYSIKTTIMKSNINEIEELIKLAIEFNCPSIKFNCVREDGRAELNSNGLILTREEYINTIKEIENMKKLYKDSISIKAPLNPFCMEEYNYISELGFGCFAGKESICVDPMGNVRPCTHFSDEFICGNIKSENLTDIWYNNSILNEFRTLLGNEECNNCGYYNKCRGGCRYRAFSSGDLNGVDPYCYKS